MSVLSNKMISGPLWESYGNTPARWTLRLTTTLRANLKSFEDPLELQHRLELFGRFSRFWLHRPIFQFSMCFDVLRCVSMCFVLLADRCLILGCGTSENFQEPRKPLWHYRYIWIIHMDNMDSGGWSICDVNGISCSIFMKFSGNPHWRLPSPANRPCGGTFPERSHVLHEAGQTRVQNVRLSKKWLKYNIST